MTQIITIAGRAGAGKDTFASMLADSLASRGAIVNMDRFAGPLKEASARIFGANSEDRDVKEVAVDVGYGRLMASSKTLIEDLRLDITIANYPTLLSDVFRKFSTSYWGYTLSPRDYQQVMGTEVVRKLSTNAWVSRLLRDAHSSDADFIIVPDFRFPNEKLGIPLLVYRPDLPVMQHSSEHMATKYYDIINNRRSQRYAPGTVEGIDVVWNVGDEHLLWTQADLQASRLMLVKRLGAIA